MSGNVGWLAMPVSVQPAPADASHQASEWPSCARRLLSAYHEMVDQECKRIIFVRFDTRYELGLNNAAMPTLDFPGTNSGSSAMQAARDICTREGGRICRYQSV